MSVDEPMGLVVGRGRTADVYTAGPGRVLRQYRTARDLIGEAALMIYLHGCGYPVPRLYRAHGRAMVMQGLTGPTMSEDLLQRPWLVTQHARTLASLHRRLHEIPAPPGLTVVGAPRTMPGAPAGEPRVLHMDLHPGNVMLTDEGPMVIDWSDATVGHPLVDVTQTVVLIAAADLASHPWWRRALARGGSRLFLRQFVAALGEDLAPYLPAAAAVRLGFDNVSPTEAVRLRRLAGRQLSA